MKICSNCNSAGFDRYLHHENEPEIVRNVARPVSPNKLYRCIDCGITLDQAEYDSLEVLVLSPPGT